jgi:hypothetical protein
MKKAMTKFSSALLIEQIFFLAMIYEKAAIDSG